MSAAREGEHIAREGRAFEERMKDGVVTAAVDSSTTVQGGARAGQFQRKFEAYDSHDDVVNTKMSLMDKEGQTPFGVVNMTDEDARWLERKAAAAETANLDAWFNTQFNKNNLADRQWAQEIYPDFYAAREQEMLRRTQEAFRIKMIQLRGPQNKEDLYRLWLIQTGRVILPDDWDRIGADPSASMSVAQRQSLASKTFLSGLIRRPLFSNVDERVENAKNLKTRRLWGDETAAPNFVPPWGSAGTVNSPLPKPGDSTLSKKILQGLNQVPP